MIKRVIVIVLDGVGVGETPDSADYGDEGSNSVGNTAEKLGGLDLPNLQKLGLGNIITIKGVAPTTDAAGAWGKMRPISAGKDSVTGHWELMGIHLKRPFPTYPDGFPAELVEEISRKAGVTFIGNKAASGTEILKELGAEHVRTKSPILYTSADSVFQIAAHEEVIPLERLYEICEIARGILQGEHNVGRVIARPFIGDEHNGFQRTTHRHDYSLQPTGYSVMDGLTGAGKEVHAIGKIYDLFGGRGISQHLPAKSNVDSLEALTQAMSNHFEGLIFANLIEFDSIFGHRNDYQGYAAALQEFDRWLPKIEAGIAEGDLVIISADHGVDPTTPSTDHSREHVPLLVYGMEKAVDLGTRQTLADVAATIAEIFKIEKPSIGQSFLKEIL